MAKKEKPLFKDKFIYIRPGANKPSDEDGVIGKEVFFVCLDDQIRCRSCFNLGKTEPCLRWVAHENGLLGTAKCNKPQPPKK